MSQKVKRTHAQPGRGRRGQVLVVVLLGTVMLLGFTAFALDFGRLYIAKAQLQASTDAAALAGAAVLPNGGSAATTSATTYSGVSGNQNSYFLSGVTMSSGYPVTKCLTALANQGVACISNANAIQVKQEVTVPMTFAKLVGTSSVKLTAMATAAMRGAAYAPYNVAIVVDSTASMNSSDGGTNCAGTKEACALAGVRSMLSALSPCGASLSSCGAATNGQVANSVDEVSLFTFPAVTSGTVARDYTCSSSAPSISQYPTASPYTIGGTAAYQIVGFSSDYRTSVGASSLNVASKLVIAGGGKANCPANPPGLQVVGGKGTYYPGAIYAAQSALAAASTARSNTQNLLIILGDGDASASASNIQGPLNDSGGSSGTYPSSKKQCGQAVTAAQYATGQGTKVYSIAYGAPTSGCSTGDTITACQTMQQMASTTNNFFSDSTSKTGGCNSTRSVSSLTSIFQVIASDLTVAKLIPNNLQ
ncbi:MAG: pilus assembly protein TadG-related protein [Bryobacteraceae bacterium]